jgi:hypothetical protein
MRRFKKKLDGTVVELFPNETPGLGWVQDVGEYRRNSTFKARPKEKDKKPTKKRKKSTIKVLDELLWNIVSQYIRRRDADEFGMCKCITCGARKHWKDMQAGHWLSRSLLAVKFLEQNINAQCYRCNIHLSGLQDQHGLAIDRKYGQGTTVAIRQKSVEEVHYTVADYHAMIQVYKTKLDQLPELPGRPV